MSSTRIARPPLAPWIGAAAILALVTWFLAHGVTPERLLAAFAGSRPHSPDLGPLLRAAPQVRIHVAAALTALIVGTVLLLGVKGNRLHRALGWIWVVAMATVAVSSLFIHLVNPGGFSLIHLFTGWTLIALPFGVWFARRHDVKRHRRTMTGLFVGGLLIAGLFTFVPGRLMWSLVFG